MSEQIKSKILNHLQSDQYRPQRPRGLAKELHLEREEQYGDFREALRELMRNGRVILGSRGAILLPSQKSGRDEFVGTYRHNKRGFGFVVPTDPSEHEDLYIPQGENNGAINGDTVRAKITSRGQRDGKAMYTGRITEVIERKHSRFVGSLIKQGTTWMVLPDGNQFTEAILTPDAAHAERWRREVDAACVIVNASTRFHDGGELGLGAEIGIATSRLHWRGPMGLESLTTMKWIIEGEGQIRR